MVRVLTYFAIITSGTICSASEIDSLKRALVTSPYNESIKIYNHLAGLYAKQKSDSAFFYYQQAIDLATKANDTVEVLNTALFQLKQSEEVSRYADLGQQVQFIEKYLNPKTERAFLIDFEKTKGRIYWKTRDFSGAFHSFSKLRNLAQRFSDVETEAIALNNLGLVYSETGHFDSALTMHNSALSKYLSMKAYQNVSSTYNLMGNACLRLNKFNEAISNYNQSVNYSAQVGDSAGIARTLNNLAKTYSRNGKTDNAISNLNRALTIWQSLGESASVAVIYNELGSTYRGANNYTKALENFQIALQIRRNSADVQQISATLNNIGTIYKDINMLETALEYYEEALTMHQSLSNDALIALSLNYIGGIYYKRGQFDHALDYYLSALGYYEVIDDKIENARVQNNVALMYKNLGNFEKALEYYLRSLELYQSLTDHKSTADILNNIGNLFLVQKKSKQAMEYFLQSQQIRKEIRDFRGLARTNFDLALTEIENKKLKPAIKHLQMAWNERRVNLGYEMRRDIARKMSELHESENDFKSALIFRKQFEAYHDSLINQDLLLKLTEVKTQNEAEKLQFIRSFEIEKKEVEVKAILREQQTRESLLLTENRLQKFIRNLFILLAIAAIIIALLLFSRYKNKNRINKELEIANEHLLQLNNQLKQSREQLQLTGHTKDTLSNIILHDLKRPYISFLHSAEMALAKDTENSTSETLSSFIQSATAIYNLLENLLDWSKQQTDSIEFHPQSINPHIIVAEIVEMYAFQLTIKKISIHNQIPENLSIYCDPTLFSFVLRNIIGFSLNSLQDHGVITIQCVSEHNQYKFSVVDNRNGSGDFKTISLINKRESLSVEQVNAIPEAVKGLYFSKEFITLWKGDFSVNSQVNKGTNFEFTIPLLPENQRL
jgi:tetratricopeptide (TPR) repeat protein